jgi:phospholipase D1/2
VMHVGRRSLLVRPQQTPSSTNDGNCRKPAGAADRVTFASSAPIAVPGQNCWRVAHASRAAFLVDASAYFDAFAQAVENARRSIFIVAWDVHSRTRLRPDQPLGRYPDEFGPFLDALVHERRDLHVYILSWDFNLVYAFERERLPGVKLGWKTHRRLRFCLDNNHPVGASQHQKIVVVDDAIAFSGGLDLTIRRWDTPEHQVQHPGRVDHHGAPYSPFHDIQLLVDGPAAKALAELARERWFRRTGECIPPTPVDADPWPCTVQPDVTDTNVVIARTGAAYAGRPEVREAEALYLDSIAAARRYIYIENQYFTSWRIADALGARLSEANGPEVLIVGPREYPGWIEQKTMGILRNRFVQRLKEYDRFGRLRFVYPVLHDATPCPVFIHSKICIIDDMFARVGSANLSNRSLGYDTECDLAIESGGNPQVETTIACFRNRLLGEHLGVSPAQVEDAITAQGSLIAAVDSLQKSGRGFEVIEVQALLEADSLVPESSVFDPVGPIDPTDLITTALPTEAVQRSHWPVVRLAIVLSLLVLLGSLWRWTPLHEWISPTCLAAWMNAVADWPFAPLVVGAGIVLGSLVMIPLNLLVLQAAFLFGPVTGFLTAFTGALVSAVAAFLIGRTIGRDGLQGLSTPRLERLCRRLARRGVLAVAAIRLLPIAPFTMVNLVLGAARIKPRHFTIGTAIGLTPGLLALSIFGDRLGQAIRRPDTLNFLSLGLVAIAVILGGVWLVRRVQRGVSRGVERD